MFIHQVILGVRCGHNFTVADNFGIDLNNFMLLLFKLSSPWSGGWESVFVHEFEHVCTLTAKLSAALLEQVKRLGLVGSEK